MIIFLYVILMGNSVVEEKSKFLRFFLKKLNFASGKRGKNSYRHIQEKAHVGNQCVQCTL